jgi:Domain of unknown function (DUF1876)
MMHIANWPIRLSLTEDEDHTVARVILHTRDNVLTAKAHADRDPSDPLIPEIGDELAAGRALVDLGHQLIRAAGRDIGVYSEEPVLLHD